MGSPGLSHPRSSMLPLFPLTALIAKMSPRSGSDDDCLGYTVAGQQLGEPADKS